MLPTRQQMFQQGAREVETKSFEGSLINYQYFKTIFKEVVEKKIDDPRPRLKTHHVHSRRSQRINQTLHPATPRSLKIFMHLAKRKLRIDHLSGKGMQRHIVSFLNKCDSVGNGVKWNTMDTPNVICMLISKLLLSSAYSRRKKSTLKK